MVQEDSLNWNQDYMALRMTRAQAERTGNRLAKTSITHPLRIDALPVGNGKLGITFCPGKKAISAFGPAWDRDLDVDLDAIKEWGTSRVLTLIEDHEFDLLSVQLLERAVKARGIDWHHFPIRDADVPMPEAMDRWRAVSPLLHETLESGGRVVVHCRGGLGRAGTVAALVLIERGNSATAAIQNVRSVRSGAIETSAQERWLEIHAQRFRRPFSVQFGLSGRQTGCLE